LTSLEVAFTSRAKKEVDAAQNEIEASAKGFGGQFATRISQATERISNNPLGSPEIRRGVRRVVLRQFRYLIFYRVESERVVVLACIHQRDNPATWPLA
jgi:plasmid stabilization system protein ParE